MDFTSALILSLIVVIVVYIALRALKVRGFSSLAVALLIGLLVMLAVANPRDMANLNVQNIQSYSFIVGIVVIILIIYILVHGLGDREPKAAPFSILPTWGSAAPVVVAQPQAVVV